MNLEKTQTFIYRILTLEKLKASLNGGTEVFSSTGQVHQ